MQTEPRLRIKKLITRALQINALVKLHKIEGLDGLLNDIKSKKAITDVFEPAIERHLDDFEQAVIHEKTKLIIVEDVRKALTTRTQLDIALEWFFFAAAFIAALLLTITTLLLAYDGNGSVDQALKSAMEITNVNVVGAIRLTTYGALALLIFACLIIGWLRIRNNN